jgi:hypothetical protein
MDRSSLLGSEAPPPIGEPAPDPDPDSTLTVSLYLSGEGPSNMSGKDIGDFFAEQFGLVVQSVDPELHRVTLSGSVRSLENAFGVQLRQRRLGQDVFITYDGPLNVPSDVAPTLVAVLGLDRRPIARRRSEQQ